MQRDYILRLIEQAGAILKHLLRRISDRSASRAELRADMQRAAHLGGLDLDVLRVCDADGLMQVVAPTGEPDPARAWLAAETLYLDGLAAEHEEQMSDAAASYAKAAALYRTVAPNWILPSGFPEAAARLAEIEERLTVLLAAGDGAPTEPHR